MNQINPLENSLSHLNIFKTFFSLRPNSKIGQCLWRFDFLLTSCTFDIFLILYWEYKNCYHLIVVNERLLSKHKFSLHISNKNLMENLIWKIKPTAILIDLVKKKWKLSWFSLQITPNLLSIILLTRLTLADSKTWLKFDNFKCSSKSPR